MSITVNNPIMDVTEFYRQLRRFVGQRECDRTTPYWDSAHIPTIGVGFNLRVKESRDKVFKQMGIGLESPMAISLTEIIYDTSISEANLGPRLAEVYGKPFIMTQTQIDAVFKVLIGSSVTAAQTASGLPYSQELIALASLHYNTPALFGSGLKAALNLSDSHDARAEAWYQIRYAHADQLHKRRYAEAALFGLYDNPSAAGKDESLAVYRMYTRHRLEANSSSSNMISYDQSHALQISEANKDLAAAGFSASANALKDELTPAANALQADIRTRYGVDSTFNPLNIQVASDKAFILAGEEIDTRTGSRDDLLIGRENGQNWLAGCAGNDVLIGGAGNDYLDGGEGDDILIGGEGVDTYIIKGHDRIVDVGRNNIVWNGQLIAGVFAAEEGQAGMYRFISDDQEWSLVFHSPGQLTLSAADSVTFENQTSAGAFSGCDFGFYLTESRTPAEVTGITVRGDLKAYLFKDCDGHYTTMTNGYGNIIVDEDTPQPGRADTLFGSGLNDALYGLGGDDELLSRDGDDTLDGGDGSDRLMGDNFDQTGSGNDQLFGGDGDDELLGDDGHDRLEGGEGDVGAGHPEKADDYALSWRLAA